jgi:putative ABC transport system substrate-binding protein
VNPKSKIQNPKVFLVGALLFALCSSAQAQQNAKVAKIGWLGARPAATATEQRAFLWRELRALGYVEGKNIVFEYRYADNQLESLPVLANELVRLNVDVLLTSSTAETLAAKNATRTIPIVFLGGGDPVAAGLIDSLARPGGNITGFATIAPVLAGKRLELLKETVTKVSRVAVLWNPQIPGLMSQWEEVQLAALKLSLQLHSMEVRRPLDFDAAFKEAIKAGSDALFVTGSPFNNSYQKQIAHLATKNRLPAIYTRGDYVAHGGLMSYGTDLAELYRRAATMVDKILKGRKPADIPVEQPTKFELVINLKTAKQIGVTIPPNVLARADKVIK